MKKFVIIIIIFILIILGYLGYKELTKDPIKSTEENCFEFENGTILNYHQICGTNIIIPDEINNTKVTSISSFAFKDKEVESVVISNNITSIGIGAFQNNQIRSIVIPESVLEIKALAFENNKIKDLTIGKNVKSIGVRAFNNNELKSKYAFIYERTEEGINKEVIIGYGGKNKNVVIPNGTKKISFMALASSNIETIILNEDLERIESKALEDNLFTKIIIPNQVNYIGDSNFTSNKLISIQILGKTVLTDFDYFDKEFVRTNILQFGELE